MKSGRKRSVSVRRHILVIVSVWIVGAAGAIAFRDSIAQLGSWGYVGAFFISAISNATILFPGPGVAILTVMAQDFNPILLGIVAGLGSALGSSTAYLVGRLGTSAVDGGRFHRVALWCMRRFGGFILFTFTLIPFLPMDGSSILAGICRYPLYRFYVYVSVASMIKMVSLLYGFTVFQDSLREWLNRWLENWSWIGEALGSFISF